MMNTTKTLFIFIAAIFTCACLLLSPVSMAKDLTLVLDVSGSNPLLADTNFNRNAALYVSEKIQVLKQGDRVLIKTFGALDKSENFNTKVLHLKRHNAKKVALAVAKYIMTLPKASTAQGSTNLLAWFNRNPVDCRQGGTVLVLTDGIEASEYVNPNHLLSGKQSLPKPGDFVQIKGCEVVFYGVGMGRLDTETNRLRLAWREYFTQAGAAFTAVAL